MFSEGVKRLYNTRGLNSTQLSCMKFPACMKFLETTQWWMDASIVHASKTNLFTNCLIEYALASRVIVIAIVIPTKGTPQNLMWIPCARDLLFVRFPNASCGVVPFPTSPHTRGMNSHFVLCTLRGVVSLLPPWTRGINSQFSLRFARCSITSQAPPHFADPEKSHTCSCRKMY